MMFINAEAIGLDTVRSGGPGDDNIDALAFIPGSDELALVGESIYLWDPVRQAVVAWPLPAEHGGIGTGERFRFAPWGLFGGKDGKPGRFQRRSL